MMKLPVIRGTSSCRRSRSKGRRSSRRAKVLCIGTGGLGSPIALYLAAAGVGTLGLIDFDIVDYSNLQRQVLHGTKDVGRKKLNSARDRIKDVNPNVHVVLHDAMFRSDNATEIVEDYDIVIDGTDNFPTRYLSNDVCVFLDKPNIYGSIFRFEGQCTVFAPSLDGPCYRCLYPEPPPPGHGAELRGGWRAWRVAGGNRGDAGHRGGEADRGHRRAAGRPPRAFRCVEDEVPRVQGPHGIRRARFAARHPSITELIDYDQFCGIPQAQAAEDAEPPVPEISVEELKAKKDRGERFVLLDVREQYEYDIASIPGSQLIPLGELPSRMSELDTRG